jgi:hypothetical protein
VLRYAVGGHAESALGVGQIAWASSVNATATRSAGGTSRPYSITITLNWTSALDAYAVTVAP